MSDAARVDDPICVAEKANASLARPGRCGDVMLVSRSSFSLARSARLFDDFRLALRGHQRSSTNGNRRHERDVMHDMHDMHEIWKRPRIPPRDPGRAG